MSEKSRVGAFCQWRESQNHLFSPLCREPLSNTLSNPYGFWPFSTKWVDKVHDKGPRTPFVGRLLQKVSGAENFVGSLCRNLCRIGHFSIQASTKFATKMQNQHFRNRRELACLFAGGLLFACPTATGLTPPAQSFEAARSHWSYQPIRRPAPPQVRGADRVQTPIDAFLLAKLEAKGLTFA